jgi:hypothetical protein
MINWISVKDKGLPKENGIFFGFFLRDGKSRVHSFYFTYFHKEKLGCCIDREHLWWIKGSWYIRELCSDNLKWIAENVVRESSEFVNGGGKEYRILWTRLKGETITHWAEINLPEEKK